MKYLQTKAERYPYPSEGKLIEYLINHTFIYAISCSENKYDLRRNLDKAIDKNLIFKLRIQLETSLRNKIMHKLDVINKELF